MRFVVDADLISGWARSAIIVAGGSFAQL